MAAGQNQIGNGTRRPVRFGPYELDLNSGELRKHGIRIRLQSQPFQVLKSLVENAGSIVTREDLRARLWPGETFVDFENGLNTAINRARLALGDSSESPRYIETLTRVGYRFIAAVESADLAHQPLPVETVPLPSTNTPAQRRFSLRVVAAIAVIAGGAAYLAWPRDPPYAPALRQITFRRGILGSARFAPSGDAILYSAKWHNEQQAIFLTDPVSPESRSLGVSSANIASISARGELALLTFAGTMNIGGGLLSRVPMNGGAPLVIDRNIMSADFDGNGDMLAVVRAIKGANQLEFPIGTALYRTPGWLGGVRISRHGAGVAFIDHPVRHDDAGALKLIEPSGNVRILADGWSNISGLAWHPVTKEVWFTAARKGALKSLWACSIRGKLRAVAQTAGALTLRDISPAGRVLLSRDSRRLEMAARIRNEPGERELSFHDWSRVQAISPDGSLVLFDESGEAAGARGVIYITRTKDGSTVRLDEGAAMGISASGTQVLALDTSRRDRLRLLSLNGSGAQFLPSTGLQYQWARYFPDGQRLLVLGNKPGAALSLFALPVRGGSTPTVIISDTMVRNVAISPDSERVAALMPDGKLVLHSTSGKAAQVVPVDEPLAPIHWSRRGDFIFVQHMRGYTDIPARVSKLDVRSGRLERWRELSPADTTGVHSVTGIAISEDEQSYVYSYRRFLSELYIADGWR